MIETIIIAVAVLIVASLIYAATKPSHFQIQRSATIKASPDKLFPLINDLHTMQTWSAWETVDPAMNRSYSGEASGKGAKYAWEGKMIGGKFEQGLANLKAIAEE